MNTIVGTSSGGSSADKIRELFRSLKDHGVKFTPSLERMVRDFSVRSLSHIRTELDVNLIDVEAMFPQGVTPLDVLDVFERIKSNNKAFKDVLADVKVLEEEAMDLAEAILRETLKMFEEVLTKPIQAKEDGVEQKPTQTREPYQPIRPQKNVCFGMG